MQDQTLNGSGAEATMNTTQADAHLYESWMRLMRLMRDRRDTAVREEGSIGE